MKREVLRRTGLSWRRLAAIGRSTTKKGGEQEHRRALSILLSQEDVDQEDANQEDVN